MAAVNHVSLSPSLWVTIAAHVRNFCLPAADHFDYSNVGEGGEYWWKKYFRPKFVFLRLRSQHPFLHKTNGPTRNPCSPTPPPSFGGRPCHPPTSLQSNFEVA